MIQRVALSIYLGVATLGLALHVYHFSSWTSVRGSLVGVVAVALTILGLRWIFLPHRSNLKMFEEDRQEECKGGWVLALEPYTETEPEE